jgi:hypothetical protein
MRDDIDDDVFSAIEIATAEAAIEAGILAERDPPADLRPRESVCPVGQIVHVAGTVCFCAQWPVQAALAAPEVGGKWQPVDVWLRAAGLYSPLPKVDEEEGAEWAA